MEKGDKLDFSWREIEMMINIRHLDIPKGNFNYSRLADGIGAIPQDKSFIKVVNHLKEMEIIKEIGKESTSKLIKVNQNKLKYFIPNTDIGRIWYEDVILDWTTKTLAPYNL